MKWPWVAAATIGAFLAGTAGWKLAPQGQPQRSYRFTVSAPEGTKFVDTSFAVSPDGTRLAFVAARERNPLLWVHNLVSGEARSLAGTAGAVHPFWSPDGQNLGFFADSSLKRVAAAGGLIQTICEAGNGYGGTWGADGVIYFAPGPSTGLHRVKDSGGRPAPAIEKPPGIVSLRWPHRLPGDNGLIFQANRPDSASGSVYWAIPGSKATLLTEASMAADVLADPGSGYLFYGKGNLLLGQRFDWQAKRLDPDSVVIAPKPPSIVTFTGVSTGGGALAFWDPQSTDAVLGWQDRAGGYKILEGAFAISPRLSPDAMRFAASSEGSSEGIWLYRLDAKESMRVMVSTGITAYPVWSPDGKHIAFRRKGSTGMAVIPADGSGAERPLLTGSWIYPLDWSPDGRYLLYSDGYSNGGDLGILSMQGESKSFPYKAGPGSERHGQFSPNGKWIAYTSDESGPDQVYVQAFDGRPASGGARYQVSVQGGAFPRWRRDGKEIYYISGAGKLVASTVAEGVTLAFGPAEPLFDFPVRFGIRQVIPYDVMPGGKRFLISRDAPNAPQPSIHVITNVVEEMKRLASAATRP